MIIKVAIRAGILSWFVGASLISFAQASTDLYLFSLQKTADGQYHIYSPVYLSGFSKAGYITQPSFTSSGDLLVSVRIAGETQYDIWELSPSRKMVNRLTLTHGSEFSPQISPDGKYLTVLKLMKGEEFHQEVVNINFHSNESKSVTGDLKDIGSYTWISAHEMGLYTKEGNDAGLSCLDVKDNTLKRITTSVGRTLHSDSDGHLIYVHKFDPEYWYIKKYKPETSGIEVVTVTPVKAEDFAISRDGTYFIAKGHILYYIDPALQTTWTTLADLSIYGINFIKELVVSGDGKQLALIATP